MDSNTLVTASHLVVWAVAYSIAGWIYETILVSAQERKFVDRGFLNGPLCPIYGAGAITAIIVFQDYSYRTWKDIVIVFLASSTGACILEYATSWAMEKMFHARWWDYSDFKFNINGRICLLGAVVFGACGVLIVFIVQPFVADITDMVMPMTIIYTAVGLSVLVTIDFIVTIVGLTGFKDNVKQFKIRMTHEFSEYSSKISWNKNTLSKLKGMIPMIDLPSNGKPSKVSVKRRFDAGLRKVFSFQQLRMLRSFPKFHFIETDVDETGRVSSRKDSIVDTIKEFFKNNGRYEK